MSLVALTIALLSNSAVSSSPQLECFRKATQSMNLDKPAAILLCREADSEAPALCYKAMVNLQMPSFDRDLTIQLCQNANSIAPAECFNEAVRKQSLTHQEALTLCKPK